jgi:hypothetical protein
MNQTGFSLQFRTDDAENYPLLAIGQSKLNEIQLNSVNVHQRSLPTVPVSFTIFFHRNNSNLHKLIYHRSHLLVAGRIPVD